MTPENTVTGGQQDVDGPPWIDVEATPENTVTGGQWDPEPQDPLIRAGGPPEGAAADVQRGSPRPAPGFGFLGLADQRTSDSLALLGATL